MSAIVAFFTNPRAIAWAIACAIACGTTALIVTNLARTWAKQRLLLTAKN